MTWCLWVLLVLVVAVALVWAGIAKDEREDEAFFAQLRRERERAEREAAERDAIIGEWT